MSSPEHANCTSGSPPLPAAASSQPTTSLYRHNPYANIFRERSSGHEVSYAPMLHEALVSSVTFVTFPVASFTPATWHPIFIGQLPLGITRDRLYWLFLELTGKEIFGIQFIEKQSMNQQRRGCVHAYCRLEDWPAIEALHERVLFDSNGVWVAESEAEEALLNAHCAQLGSNSVQNLPRQPLVVQTATSHRVSS